MKFDSSTLNPLRVFDPPRSGRRKLCAGVVRPIRMSETHIGARARLGHIGRGRGLGRGSGISGAGAARETARER